jgi:hypothetical protein
MQAVVTVVSILVQVSVIFAFRYLQITWLILSGIGGIVRTRWLRETWISSVKKIGLVLFVFSVISVFWSSIFFSTSSSIQITMLLHSIDFKVGETTLGEILAASILSGFTWLLIAFSIAQGLAVKSHVSDPNWFTWIITSTSGTLLGAVLGMALQASAHHTWGFLVVVCSSLGMAISQLLTFGHLNSERRGMLTPIWLVGWLNMAVFIYFFDFFLSKLLEENYAFRSFLLQLNPQVQHFLTLTVPMLFATGWLALTSNIFILTNKLPDEAFEPDEDNKPSTAELFAFGLADVSGQIAGNVTREVGKVVGEEFKRSTRR